MIKPTIHEDDNDSMKQPNQGEGSSNARPSSNGFTAQADPSKSGSPSPPSAETDIPNDTRRNDGGQLPSCKDAEVEERFKKFLEIMGEIDLQRLSDMRQQALLNNKSCQPNEVPAYNRTSVSKKKGDCQ